jgi:hypothetical protein
MRSQIDALLRAHCDSFRPSRPAHTRHLGSAPRLLTEQLPQTTFPHATHPVAVAASYPKLSTSIIPSSAPPLTAAPQSSQSVWLFTRLKAALSTGGGGAMVVQADD